MHPLLFLDFDGVLNSARFFSKQKAGGTKNVWDSLDPSAVATLNQIVSGAGSDVVVSSTWRVGHDVPWLQLRLDEVGFTGWVVGKTPILPCREHKTVACNVGHRGAEVNQYLTTAFGADWTVWPKFAILDDGGDLAPFVDRLVQTDYNFGLQQEHVERTVALLEEHEK